MKFDYKFIPKERIIVLQKLDLEKLARKHENFRKTWKEEKKCSCVLELNENQLPCCEHIKKAISEEFREDRKRIWKRTIGFFLSSLRENKHLNNY